MEVKMKTIEQLEDDYISYVENDKGDPGEIIGQLFGLARKLRNQWRYERERREAAEHLLIDARSENYTSRLHVQTIGRHSQLIKKESEIYKNPKP